MKRFILLTVVLALVLPACASAAPRVGVRGGIVCRYPDGHTVRLTHSRRDTEPTLSPDGHHVAFVRVLHKQVPYEMYSVRSALWLGDCATGSAHEIVASTPQFDKAGHYFGDSDNPRFSLNGGYLYFETSEAPTSGAVHQFNLATGAHRLVTYGGDVRVIRSGPYRGDLLVSQHTCKPGGGCLFPFYIIRPDGQTIQQISGSEQWTYADLAAWLRTKGWKAW